MTAAHTATQTLTTVAHTCRDDGYSPKVKACQGCLSQLSINGYFLTKRKPHNRKPLAKAGAA